MICEMLGFCHFFCKHGYRLKVESWNTNPIHNLMCANTWTTMGLITIESDASTKNLKRAQLYVNSICGLTSGRKIDFKKFGNKACK